MSVAAESEGTDPKRDSPLALHDFKSDPHPNGHDDDPLPPSPTQSIRPVEVVMPRPSRILSSSPELENPHTMVITSLRTQISDLYSQVTLLNNKLVQSYDRVSDLEDSLHFTAENLRASTGKIQVLEAERDQHLQALNNGLLVEREHVTAELTRLMEKATDEAAQRGQAENDKAAIEKDLDDLSATLFHQANSMVAEARLDKARSEAKVDESLGALKSAEEALSVMQTAMQALRDEKEEVERDMQLLRERMGKGKWVDRSGSGGQSLSMVQVPPRLMTSHVPYHEFLAFISHLRTIRPASITAPPMSTFLPLPFIARLLAEDSDPTLRLDSAPSLNWLTRRSVLTAVHHGQLTIEPMHIASLFLEAATSSSPTTLTSVSCALCGQNIYTAPSSEAPPAPANNAPPHHQTTQSWSTSRFLKKPLGVSLPGSASANTTTFPTETITPVATGPSSSAYNLQTVIYAFRVSLPAPQKPSAPYPLCHAGWCLTRLRATCELWRFMRQNVIDRVWDEQVVVAPQPPPKPVPTPNPPKKSTVGALWGMASNALGMDKGGSGASSPVEIRPLQVEKQNPPRGETAPLAVESKPLPQHGRVPSLSYAPPPIIPPRRRAPSMGAAAAGGHSRVHSTTELLFDSEHVDGKPASDSGSGANGESAAVSTTTPAADAATTATTTTNNGSTDPAPADDQGQETGTAEKSATEAPPAKAPNPILMPKSPTRVALPDSRPSSPLRAVSPPPARVISPPIRSGSPHVPHSPTVARMGSPALPLVPRRAAARRPAPAAPGATTVTTPVTNTVGLPETTSPGPEQHPHTSPASKRKSLTRPLSFHAPALGGLPENEATDGANTTAIVPVAPAAGPPPERPPRGPSRGATPGANGRTTPNGQTTPNTTGSPHKGDGSTAAVNGLTTPETGRRKTPLPSERGKTPVPLPTHEEEARTYAGDGVWEEKMWKELVRLREEMFWARMGGFR